MKFKVQYQRSKGCAVQTAGVADEIIITTPYDSKQRDVVIIGQVTGMHTGVNFRQVVHADQAKIIITQIEGGD